MKKLFSLLRQYFLFSDFSGRDGQEVCPSELGQDQDHENEEPGSALHCSTNPEAETSRVHNTNPELETSRVHNTNPEPEASRIHNTNPEPGTSRVHPGCFLESVRDKWQTCRHQRQASCPKSAGNQRQAGRQQRQSDTPKSAGGWWQSARHSVCQLPWKKILLGIGITAVCFIGLFLGILWYLIASAPDIDTISVSPTASATYICDAQGNYIRKLTLASSNRDIVSLDEIPEYLQQAVIAIEDERFYEHGGIDIKGIIRAFWNGITRGSFQEGASTITQQLIKNNVFTEWTQENSFADRFSRKVQEQYLALQLEDRIGKKEILEDYLNTINLGSGCYGVQAAARRYFGKNVSELSLSECAVLAAIPQNPTGYNPIRFPEANRRRQLVILNYMEKQGYITSDLRKKAENDRVYDRILEYDSTYDEEDAYSYYEDALIDQALSILTKEKGYSEEQAYRAVYSGGLRIYSAQDTALQQICEEEFANPANFPSGTEFGIDYALSVSDPAGTVTHYGSDALRTFIRQQFDPDFNLMCTSADTAQRYADAFREATLAKAEEERKNARANAEAGREGNAAKDGAKREDTAAKDGVGHEDRAANDDALEDVPALTILGERLTLSPEPQASLVLMDQSTGYVRAIVGGRGEKSSSLTLNRAVDSTRQPGSTFKILAAYAPALDASGKTLATLYDNEPYEYADGTPVSNWDITDYSGPTTIREAITRSINVIAVRCITEISTRLGFQYAERFGITTLHETYQSGGSYASDLVQPLALGGITQGVTNLELCGAYASIANGGIYHTPKFFTKIVDRHGETLFDFEDSSSRTAAGTAGSSVQDPVSSATAGTSSRGLAGSIAVSANAIETAASSVNASAMGTTASSVNANTTGTTTASSVNTSTAGAASTSFTSLSLVQRDNTRILNDSTAYLLTDAMRDVVEEPSGTAYGSISAAGQPVAGKTGTTSSYKDIWFAGYTPYYTCSVWGGYDNNQTLPDGALFHTYQKTLWSAVMNRVHTGLPIAEFEQPASIVSTLICPETGLLAVPDGCPGAYTELFASGTEPQQECPLHEPIPETEPIIIYPDILEELFPEIEIQSEAATESESSDITVLPEHGFPGQTSPGSPAVPEQNGPGSPAVPDQTNPGSPTAPDQSNPGSPTAPDQNSPGSSDVPDQSNPGSPTAPDQSNPGSSAAPDQNKSGSSAVPDQNNPGSSVSPDQTETNSLQDLLTRLYGPGI